MHGFNISYTVTQLICQFFSFLTSEPVLVQVIITYIYERKPCLVCRFQEILERIYFCIRRPSPVNYTIHLVFHHVCSRRQGDVCKNYTITPLDQAGYAFWRNTKGHMLHKIRECIFDHLMYYYLCYREMDYFDQWKIWFPSHVINNLGFLASSNLHLPFYLQL